MTPTDILNSVTQHPTSSASCERKTIDTSDSEREFELSRREQIIREKDQLIIEHHEEHELRKRYLERTFKFVSWVTFVALAMTFMKGVGGMNLSDSVLITLLTTTIANVLGCLLIAFNWLFPKRSAADGSPSV